MAIMGRSTCGESLNRAWRRRKYQRFNVHEYDTRKLKIKRLAMGNIIATGERFPKLISPIKILTKFHDAYVETMLRLVKSMGKANNSGGLLRGKKIAKDRHVKIVSGGDEVDTRFLLQIYKRLAASPGVNNPLNQK